MRLAGCSSPGFPEPPEGTRQARPLLKRIRGAAMRVGYSGTVQDFLARPDRVISDLSTSGRTYCVVREQARTWHEEVAMLRTVLGGLENGGRVYFEYDIPRVAKRADVVLLINGILFVLEYKVDQTPNGAVRGFNSSDVDQVNDYAYDFAYFHSIT